MRKISLSQRYVYWPIIVSILSLTLIPLSAFANDNEPQKSSLSFNKSVELVQEWSVYTTPFAISTLQILESKSWSAESPPPSIPAKNPQLDALREAQFLLGEGDRSQSKTVAREKWQAAADAFIRAEDQLGAADAYLRLADSYQLEAIFSAYKRRQAIEYYLAALTASADVYDIQIQKELSFDPNALKQAKSLYDQAVTRQQAGDCLRALPLLQESRQLYRNESFESGIVRTLMIEAICQIDAGDYFGSLTTLLEGLLIAQSLPLGTPVTERFLEAKRQYEQGNWTKALEIYQEVFQIYQENNDDDSVAQTMLDMGVIYAQTGQYVKATTTFRQALDLFLTLDNDFDDYNEAAVRHNLGNLETIAANYDEAFTQYEQAIKIWQTIGDPAHEVASLSGLGLALRGEGNYEEALATLERAWAQQQHLSPEPATEGDIRNNIGYVYHSQGNFQLALDEFERTLQMRRQLPQPHRTRKEAETFNNIAAVYASLSRFDEALATYQQALDLLPAGTPPGITAPVRANMAAVLIEQGDYQAGIATNLEILPHFGDDQQTATRAAILQNLGAAYLRLGNLAAGEKYLQQALVLFTTLDDQPSIAALNNNVGLLYAQAGRLATAQTYLQAAFTGWQTLQQQAMAAKALGNLSLITAAEGDLVTAIAHGEEALHLSESAGVLADQARIAVTLSLLHLKAGDASKALKIGEDARRLARQAGDPMAELGSALVLATAHLVKNEIAAADQAIQLAIARLEALQGSISIAEFKTTFLGQLGGIYDLAVLIALANDQPEQAFVYAEQARARAFLDQLTQGHIDFRQGGQADLRQQEQTMRQRMASLQANLATEKAKPLALQRTDALNSWEAELEGARREHSRLLGELKATNPVYAAFISAEVLSLAAVQQTAIDDQTTLILYFLPDVALSTQPLAWVIDRHSVQHFTLTMSSTEVQTKVEFLHQLLQNKAQADDPDLNAALTALYAGLFAPLQSAIHHANLVIIPHATLHYLPFAALRDEGRKRYLIEDYAITYAPSASALPLIQAQHNGNGGRLVAFGNPDGTLPEATIEVQRIAQLYDVTPWLGAQATESQLFDQATQADIIHIAAHGVYDALNPLYTRIEMAADAANDGNLEVQEVYTLDLRATNLVVLSACETALGQQSRGDELIGLTRAFFQAGAPTVMTTLWRVDDAATGALMVKFYEQLQAGATPTAALQTAQIAVLTEDKWRSPYYWAAFNLNGDYRGGEE